MTSEKKQRTEHDLSRQVLRAAAKASGVSDGETKSLIDRLPKDLAIKAIRFLDIVDVGKALGVRAIRVAIQVPPLPLLNVEVDGPSMKHWGETYPQAWTTLLNGTKDSLQTLRLGDGHFFIDQWLPNAPTLSHLHTLKISSFRMTRAVWASLLEKCPKLVRLTMERVVPGDDMGTGQDWITPHLSRAWELFSYSVNAFYGSLDPAVYIALANPAMTSLLIDADVKKVNISQYDRAWEFTKSWTVPLLKQFVAKWGRHADRLTHLTLGTNVEGVDNWDEYGQSVIAAFPNLVSRPWREWRLLPKFFSIDTVRLMYKSWRFMRRLPPNYRMLGGWGVISRLANTVIQETLGQLTKIVADKEEPFWTSWTLNDVWNLVLKSPDLQVLEVTRFRGVLDEKDMEVVTSRKKLERLELANECEITDVALRQLAGHKTVHHIVLGEHFDADRPLTTVSLETLVALSKSVAMAASAANKDGNIELFAGVVTAIQTTDDLQWLVDRLAVKMLFLVTENVGKAWKALPRTTSTVDLLSRSDDKFLVYFRKV